MPTRPTQHVAVTDAACCGAPLSEVLTDADATDAAQAFAALGDPVRLRLLSLVIANSEICSCDLEGPLERSQPTISHHTRVLAEAGLIVGERRGRWVWWSAVPERIASVAALLQAQ
jgi:ArsR family transcriptional regulator